MPSKSLGRYTLLGANSTNPLIPHGNVSGELVAEMAGLLFRPDNSRHSAFAIEWNSIQETSVVKEDAQGLDALFWWVLSPITLVTLGLVSGITCFTCVKYVEPQFEGVMHAHFKVGGAHDDRRGQELARAIWLERGNYLATMRHVTTIQRR